MKCNKWINNTTNNISWEERLYSSHITQMESVHPGHILVNLSCCALREYVNFAMAYI